MKDEHTYGERMARNGCTKVIYKGTFVSIQTLCTGCYRFMLCPTCGRLPCSPAQPAIDGLLTDQLKDVILWYPIVNICNVKEHIDGKKNHV